MSRPCAHARPPRDRDAGFTLTEMMIVVVILGILATIALPSLTRDNKAAHASEFASDVARALQRARVQAVSSRLPIRAYFMRDRVEFRSFRQPLLGSGAINSFAPPLRPNDDTAPPDPPYLVINAKDEVAMIDLTNGNAALPGAVVLTTALAGAKILQFNSTGDVMMFDSPAAATNNANAVANPVPFAWVHGEPSNLGMQNYRYLIRVFAPTGYVRMINSWTW